MGDQAKEKAIGTAARAGEIIRAAIGRWFPEIALETSFAAEDLPLIEQVLAENADVKIFWRDTGDPAARGRAEFVKSKYYVTPLRTSPLEWNLGAVLVGGRGPVLDRDPRGLILVRPLGGVA